MKKCLSLSLFSLSICIEQINLDLSVILRNMEMQLHLLVSDIQNSIVMEYKSNIMLSFDREA